MIITFAPVQNSDFETLIAIRIEAMQESLERIGRFDPIRVRERFRQGFTPECTRFIIVDDERAGFVVVKPQEGYLLLDHLYLRPIAQGKGIGQKVLGDVFAEADRKGLPVRVGALRESDANRFYLRNGFQLIEQAEFDNYYVRPATVVSASLS